MRSKQHWHSADAVRELGLQVGDVLQGRESYAHGHWHEARITLLFVGRQATVWKTERRDNYNPDEWVDDGDSTNWTLDGRDWEKVVLK